MLVTCGKRQRNKQTLDDEFHREVFKLQHFFLCCLFTNLAKYSRHAWSLCGANIS